VQGFKAPVIVHEMGQWCVYPNFDEIKKYKGPLKAKNFEIFRDSLHEHGMLDQWRDFLRASGKLQALCYKEEIEAALRTPGISGIQLLDLHDFPGQGTALVGVLDPFWDSKGYITPAEFRRFFNATVPLARMEKRTWTTAEEFKAQVEVAHFGPAPLENAVGTWKLQTGTNIVAEGAFPAGTIALGHSNWLGEIDVPLSGLDVPAMLTLVVSLQTGSDQPENFENSWTIWVYPIYPPMPAPGVLYVTSTLDEKALARLQSGAG